MFQCDICLKTFGRKDNMLRHKKSVHSDSDDDAMSDVSAKNDIFGPIEDDMSSDSDDSSDESSVGDFWDSVVDEAFQKCQSQYDSKVKELMEEKTGFSDTEAKEHVFRNMKSTYRKSVMNVFGSKLLFFDEMKQDPVYKSIKKTVNELIDRYGYDKEKALKHTLLKRRFLFDKILDTYEIPDLESDDDMVSE